MHDWGYDGYDFIIPKMFVQSNNSPIGKKQSKTIGSIRDDKYTTFWLGKDDEPESFIEYIVKNISIQDHPNGFPLNYEGIEWWSQVRDTKEDITFHYDKDEGICSLEHKYIYPIKSTITYLTNVGGPTAIFNDEEYNNGYLS